MIMENIWVGLLIVTLIVVAVLVEWLVNCLDGQKDMKRVSCEKSRIRTKKNAVISIDVSEKWMTDSALALVCYTCNAQIWRDSG